MSVSLPKSQRDWVKRRVSTGGYGNVSDYIRDLIRRDQKGEAQEELERKLLHAISSGKRIEVTPEYWAEKRRKLRERFAPRNGRGKKAS